MNGRKDRTPYNINRKFVQRSAIKPPCHGCPDRYVRIQDGKAVSCHGDCERYEKYHKQCQEANELERLARTQRKGNSFYE